MSFNVLKMAPVVGVAAGIYVAQDTNRVPVSGLTEDIVKDATEEKSDGMDDFAAVKRDLWKSYCAANSEFRVYEGPALAKYQTHFSDVECHKKAVASKADYKSWDHPQSVHIKKSDGIEYTDAVKYVAIGGPSSRVGAVLESQRNHDC